MSSRVLNTFFPAGNCMFKVHNKNSRTRGEICSKLTIKTPERCHQRHFGVLLLTFNIFHTLFYCFFINFEQANAAGLLLFEMIPIDSIERHVISSHLLFENCHDAKSLNILLKLLLYSCKKTFHSFSSLTRSTPLASWSISTKVNNLTKKIKKKKLWKKQSYSCGPLSSTPPMSRATPNGRLYDKYSGIDTIFQNNESSFKVHDMVPNFCKKSEKAHHFPGVHVHQKSQHCPREIVHHSFKFFQHSNFI